MTAIEIFIVIWAVGAFVVFPICAFGFLAYLVKRCTEDYTEDL